ncbi:MAG: AIR synthase-related protein [Actinomycetota bacterium]
MGQGRGTCHFESDGIHVRGETEANVMPSPSSGLPRGKVPADLLATLLADLPDAPPGLILGPAVGEDACAIAIPEGVLVAATDPITLTTGDIGRFGVIINGNDVAVMGVRPRWFLAVILLPSGTSREDVRRIFGSIEIGLEEVGAVLVGGHTEMTEAVNQPVLVGQMMGISEQGHFVSTGGAKPGDVLVQVGPAPVEGAAVLAVEAEATHGTLSGQSLDAAANAANAPGLSVVEPALLAAELGATAMHDPTEGGMAAGLHEIARAAGVALSIDTRSMLWFEPGLAVCEAVGADPWATLASGALLATFPQDLVGHAVDELTKRGHVAAVVGSVGEGAGVSDQAGEAIYWPERDEVARVLGSSDTTVPS